MKQNPPICIEHAGLDDRAARGRLLKNLFMTNAELDERSFGTSFDPLLHGVAYGLAKLFPPIDNVRRLEPEDEASQLHGTEDEHTDE